ncbi:MAG TPA: GxxExxY protein [Flavilitoribacter sp.]|nr:GxxExxY protein [Flavilitoribacter sp.]HMQ90476.1 GxxExxY protein [Flavilitoribacter sp.]
MLSQSIINDIAYEAVGCAITVHREMGPGLLEQIYEECLYEEMKSHGIQVARQVKIPISFKGRILKKQLRIDLLVEDLVIIECKSVQQIMPIFEAQLLTYLKLAKKPKGFLINFNCRNLSKEGLLPMVTDQFSSYPKE